MRLATLVALTSLLGVGAVGMLERPVAAQYVERPIANRFPQEWENDLFRVRRLAIAPGSQMTAAESDDSVLIFLTADLEGRMPPAEAAFQPRGTGPFENRGNRRFEAISIGLKDVPVSGARVTPPEALPLVDPADVRILIDNPRVTVLKTRYRSNRQRPHAFPSKGHGRDLPWWRLRVADRRDVGFLSRHARRHRFGASEHPSLVRQRRQRSP